jgi:hypothetical protein
VSNAGLVPVMALAGRAGLGDLAAVPARTARHHGLTSPDPVTRPRTAARPPQPATQPGPRTSRTTVSGGKPTPRSHQQNPKQTTRPGSVDSGLA